MKKEKELKKVEKCFGSTLGCSEKCRFKEACRSRADEFNEQYRSENYHVPFNEYAAAAAREASDDCEELLPVFVYEDFEIPAEVRPVLIELIQRLAVIRREQPTLFDVALSRIFDGLSQADLARIRKISRQAINKRLLKEGGVGAKRVSENKLLRLSAREIAVYKLVHEERKSYRAAGKELRISKDTVWRTILSLRRKGMVCATDKNEEK